MRIPEPITLRSGKPVKGRLVELGSNAPIAGARIEAREAGAEQPASARSDDDGSFAIASVTPGWFSLHIAASNRPRVRIELLQLATGLDLGELPIPSAAPLLDRCGFSLSPVRVADPEPAVVLVVANVDPDGPANDAGLRIGSVVTNVNGGDVSGIHHYLWEAYAARSNGALWLTLADGQTLALRPR